MVGVVNHPLYASSPDVNGGVSVGKNGMVFTRGSEGGVAFNLPGGSSHGWAATSS